MISLTAMALSFLCGPDDDALAALALAQATIQRPKEVVVETPPPPLNYYDGAKLAVANRKPLVTFVGCDARRIDGCVSASTSKLQGFPAPSIVVADPDGDWLTWRTTLAVNATDAEIRGVPGRGRERGEPIAAAPFVPSGPRAADADEFAGVPGNLTFLRELEPYTSAKRSQISFRRWSGYIGSVPRSGLESWTRFPGGLDGVSGWTSRLYRTPNAKVEVYLERQDPNDGNSTITWRRSYADVVFADVLRNSQGKVFEVRAAIKHDGKWDRYVAYRDRDAFPHGYVPVKSKDCRSCHEGPEAPGRAAYSSAAVPGGDSIFSDPIAQVESRQIVQGGFGISLGN